MPLAVEVVAEDPGSGQRNGVIQSTNNQAQAFIRRLDGTSGPDQESPLSLVRGEHGYPDHLWGVWRFADYETRETIVDEMEQALMSGPPLSWYQIRTHECDHNLQTGTGDGGCPPDVVRRSTGSAPEGI